MREWAEPGAASRQPDAGGVPPPRKLQGTRKHGHDGPVPVGHSPCDLGQGSLSKAESYDLLL